MRVFGAFRGALAALTAALLGLATCSVAWAQTPIEARVAPQRVVLLQPKSGPGRPALEPSLRIQLRDVDLTALQVDLPADVPARIAAANDIADQQSADWVVWADDAQADPSAPADQAVLYVVGRRDGRALIEVVRVPGGDGPEVDRSLALKVHELIGADDAAAYALGNKELPAPTPAAPAPDRRVRIALEAGAQATLEGEAALAPDVFIALGPRLVTPSFTFSVPIELTFGFPRSVEREGSRVEWSEVGAAVWLKLGVPIHRSLLLGGAIGGKLSITEAEGTSPSGRTGALTQRLPALLASADAELTLSSDFAAHVALGVEPRFRRQYFLVEGREIADTGRLVLFARLSLLWHPW